MTSEGAASRIAAAVGIDPRAVGPLTWAGALERRMAARGVRTPEEYGALLRGDAEEVRRLEAEVAVHESWFFRYPASFALLRRHAAARLHAEEAAPYRVLSVGCAAGCEPASALLAHHDEGLDLGRIRVDAVDVSERALEAARAGRHAARAVRDVPPWLLARWFRREGAAWVLDPALSGRIRYRLADVLDPGFRPGGPFDAIFLRNVLIYLRPEARRRAIGRLVEALAPGGLFLVGHAEVGAVAALGLVPVPPPEAFACRRGPRPSAASPATAARPGLPAASEPDGAGAPPAPLPSSPATAPPSPLARAAALADEGRLAEAVLLAEEAIAGGARTPAAYHLLAAVRSARGESEASEAATARALYLDPDHYPSLVHLALLVEARGDRAYAERLRARARRAAAGPGAAGGPPPAEAAHGDR